MLITYNHWGRLDGKEIYLFKIANSTGAFVEITNYGATLVAINVPDKQGNTGSVILGFDYIERYLEDACYIGSTIGRVANRISKASFNLNGKTYDLDHNDGRNSNHGGRRGFNTRVFDFRIDGDELIFILKSKDGDGGYPGNLTLQVFYTWTENNELKIRYEAEADQDTIANFTNHAYFNLSGERENIMNHRLTILATRILQADHEYIPTGAIVGTGPKSFSGSMMKDRVGVDEKEIKGINDYYILDETRDSGSLKEAAILDCDVSGRRMKVYTSYPGLMVYTGDFLTSRHTGKTSGLYQPFDGMCLECQFYPDAPNHPSFPSVTLKADENYRQEIVYKFSLMA